MSSRYPRPLDARSQITRKVPTITAHFFAFWFAYIITRPLGASYADWLGVPQSLGGLNYGRGTVAVGLTIAIIAWVGFLWVTEVDVERGAAAAAGTPSPAFSDGA